MVLYSLIICCVIDQTKWYKCSCKVNIFGNNVVIKRSNTSLTDGHPPPTHTHKHCYATDSSALKLYAHPF